jgi:uncharacterized protein YbjT (DUF2867 family)
VILVPPAAAGPVPRLVAAAAARTGESVVTAGPGAALARGLDEAPERLPVTRVACLTATGPGATRGAPTPGERVLVLGWIGTHRDSAVASLRELWAIEEAARGSGAPTLVLRLAPLAGDRSPLCELLRRADPPRSLRRHLVQPVLESDVIETLARAFDGRAAWQGWYEVCGPDVLTVEELAAVARRTRAAGVPPAWEPPAAMIAAQRLAESDAWREHFGITPARLTSWAGAAA